MGGHNYFGHLLLLLNQNFRLYVAVLWTRSWSELISSKITPEGALYVVLSIIGDGQMQWTYTRFHPQVSITE